MEESMDSPLKGTRVKSFIPIPQEKYTENPEEYEYLIQELVSIAQTVLPVCNTTTNPSPDSLPPLPMFTEKIIKNSKVKLQTISVASVYLTRLRDKLPKTAKGIGCTLHRLILTALVLGDKYLNDVHLRNRKWCCRDIRRRTRSNNEDVICPWFTLSDLGLMERQFLGLINYELGVKEEELSYCKLREVSPVLIEHETNEYCGGSINGSHESVVSLVLSSSESFSEFDDSLC